MIKNPKTNKFYIPKVNVNVKTQVITELEVKPDVQLESEVITEPEIEQEPLLVMKSESKVKELVNKIESKLSS